MSTNFFGVSDRVFVHSYDIGRSELAGTGFRCPVALALGSQDLIYVINRPSTARPEGVRITICTFYEDYVTEFGSYGEGNGQFVWPTAIAIDSQQNLYVTDEWLNRVTVFTKDGDFIEKWGDPGSGDGELDKPSGLAFDSQDRLYVVDSWNHRVQRFTKDGQYLGQFGGFGRGVGELNFPWGIGVDRQDLVYVADWKNDRVSQFGPDMEFLATFGHFGREVGQFNRPTAVCVDADGDLYVTDWNNHRVQVLAPDGRFISALTGEAGLSKWGREKLASNPDMVRQRQMVHDLTPERVFWNPCDVKVDDHYRIAVLEPTRHRIQVYSKQRIPVLSE